MKFSQGETEEIVNVQSDNPNYRILTEEEIHKMTEKCGNLPDYDSVITVGIGGSIRSSRAITSILGNKNHFVASHPEPNLLKNIVEESENPILHISSKSGTTIETIAMYRYLSRELDVEDERVVVTTSKNSPLSELANNRGFTLFESTRDITGRFSGFSYYSMVPTYLCGVDVQEMCSTARKCFDKNSDSKLLGAGISGLTESEILFVGTYTEKLTDFNSWLDQLWSESLGKNEKGTHISTGTGPNLQHAKLQRLLGGKQNVSVVLVRLKTDNDERTTIGHQNESQVMFDSILETSFQETAKSLRQNGIECISVEVDDTEEDIAKLLCSFEIAVINTGLKRGIDVFTQDAVDNTKKRIFDRLEE